jgi:uncharacterized protein (TIGR03435 family)
MLGMGSIVLVVLGSIFAPYLAAQTATRTFDIASVRRNTSDAPASSRYPLGPGDAYVSSGALFAATNQPLIVYLRFAFKLGQGEPMGLPSWVYDDRFDIEARTQGSPSKDDVRLMMRSLLADRFKLKVHPEKRKRPVFNLVLPKAGKLGPQIQSHVGDCATTSPTTAVLPSAPSSKSGVQLPPIPCDSIGPIAASAPDKGRLGGRKVTIDRLAGFLTNPFTGVDRPVVNRTGLAGTFDFTLEWSPSRASIEPVNSQDSGTTIFEALRDQLGLQLKSTTGPVEVLVIDHVEHPGPN